MATLGTLRSDLRRVLQGVKICDQIGHLQVHLEQVELWQEIRVVFEHELIRTGGVVSFVVSRLDQSAIPYRPLCPPTASSPSLFKALNIASIEFLAASGLKPSVSSLRCGHGYLTASGNVSHHSSGNAVDIPAVNGIPIMAHQGAGSVTEMTIERLLTLQGTMKPAQIISLMTFPGHPNAFAQGDHDDHIHVGFPVSPTEASRARLGKQVAAVLKPKQWNTLMGRLSTLSNPRVLTKPSKYSLKVKDNR